MAASLLLDRSAWDLTLNSAGNIAVASEPYSQTQDVSSAARTVLGEVYYQTNLGIPYFGQILGYRPPLQFMKAQYIKAALTVPGVNAANCFITTLTDREVTGQIQFTTSNGSTQTAGF
jgi:hypothetical protein